MESGEMRIISILWMCFVLISSLNAAYINEIYPPSMASGASVSPTYTNFIVVGEITGVSTSASYINRIGALPPMSVTPPVAGGGYVSFTNISPYVQPSLNKSLITNEMLPDDVPRGVPIEFIEIAGTAIAILSYIFITRVKTGGTHPG